MSDGIHRFLPNDEYQAAVGANNPDAANVYATIADLGGAATTLYNADGTVAAGRVATITDTLTWTSGAITRDVNSMKVVEITADDTFPSTLAANTAYIVRGTVTVTGGNEFSVTNSGSAIVGLNRDVDKIIYTGPDTLMTVTDQDFTMRNLGLCATNAAGKILEADNWTAAIADNYGRTKVLELFNLKIANTTNIWRIEGFELVDISNCLFWYISDGTLGCQFSSIRHLEISSCEFYNWFEEGNIGNLDFYHQIELDENVIPVLDPTAGFGVVNINGANVRTTTIQGALLAFDYSHQNTYIIQANQGVINGNAKGTLSIQNNSEVTTIVLAATSVVLEESTAAGPGFTNRPIFPTATKVITNIEDCSFEYNTKIKGSFFVSVNANVNTTNNTAQEIEIRLRYTPFGGSPIEITSSVGKTTVRQQIPEAIAFSVLGEANLGDFFDVVVRNNTTTDDIIIQEFSLNGYQF